MNRFLTFLFAILSLSAQICYGKNYYFTTANGSNFEWKSTIQNLKAGDVLTFAPGEYPIDPSAKLGVNINGNAGSPIIIQGETVKGVKWSRADDPDPQNMIDIQGSYFIFQNLELEGGSRGVRLGESSDVSHAVFRNLIIHRTMTSAFTGNQPAKTFTNITIVNNEIYDTGSSESECIYMGCQSNGCVTKDSLIDRNYCHDTLQATAGSLGSGIQVKTGSYNNRITNNVVKDTRGPCVLIYDSYDLGNNIVDGNYCENNGDNGIQATSGASITNNIVVNPTESAIRISNNQIKSSTVIRNLFIAHNTLLCSGNNQDCLRVDETGSTSSSTIVNNAIFSSTVPALRQSASSSGGKCGNNALYETTPSQLRGSSDFSVGTPEEELKNPSGKDFYPLPGSKLIGSGDASILNKVPLDFNGNTRTSNVTVGAFAYVEGSDGGSPTEIKGSETSVTSVTPTSTSAVSPVGSTVGSSTPRNITVAGCSSKVFVSVLSALCFFVMAF